MERFGVCLDYNRGLWKTFHHSLRSAKGNAGRLEEVYSIGLFPDASLENSLHMIVSKDILQAIWRAYFRHIIKQGNHTTKIN